MVNWLALGASNYVRSVRSEMRRIFSVFGELSDGLTPLCIAPRASHLKLLSYTVIVRSTRQHDSACAEFVLLGHAVLRAVYKYYKYSVRRYCTVRLTPAPRTSPRLRNCCTTVGLRDSVR
jgi:hypothetical protein